MRYVDINNLHKDMVIAKNIYKDKRLLVRSGTAVTNKLQDALYKFGFVGVFVDDKFSIGTPDEIDFCVDTSVTNEMASCIKELFKLPHNDSLRVKEKENTLLTLLTENYLENLVNEVFNSPVMKLNLYDLKTYDDYTFYHSVNVALFSAICAKKMKYSRDAIKDIAMAGLFHDIGKKSIPLEILNKPGTLTDKEELIMQTHPQKGFEYVRTVFPSCSSKVVAAIYQHHERMNGTGYPKGISGHKICDYARIIAVADVYDAMTSKRSYKDACLPSEAMEYIMANSEQLDADVISAFLHCIYAYPEGSLIELSDGSQGIVISQNEDFNCRPIIKLFSSGNIVNLAEILNLSIKRVLKDSDLLVTSVIA